MQHVDELFRWLAHMFVQRFDIEVIQFWAIQNYHSGQTAIELRTIVCRNPALPQQVLVNTHIAEVAERFLNEYHGVMPQPTEMVFSPQAAHLLMRHNLNYWAGYYLSRNVLIPPMNNEKAPDKISTPLHLLVSFFSQQSPNPRIIPTIGHIMEHATGLARNQGLFLPTNTAGLQIVPKVKAITPLMELVPQRVFEKDNGQGKYSQIITNRQTLRLYLSIDGRKDLTELAILTQLSKRDFSVSLRSLLTQGQIRLIEPNGLLVDKASILSVL